MQIIKVSMLSQSSQLSIESFTSPPPQCHMSHNWLYCQYHHFVFLMLEWDSNSLCHSFLWPHPVSVSRPHIGCSLPRGALHTKQDLSPAASTARAPITPRVAQNRETFRDLDKTMTALKVMIYQHCLCLWFAYYRLFLHVWNLAWYFNFDTFHCYGCGTGLWPIQSSW